MLGYAKAMGPAKIAMLGIGAAGAAVAVVGPIIGDLAGAASALGEQVNKTNVVFGRASDRIKEFGSTSAESLGLSKRAALEAAGTFGQFFTGAGAAQAEAAKMSERLVGLGADLASFNNIDPTLALEKLRAGLAGEAEPLRAVGVFLTEAKVKAKAMELGLVGAHGELSEGAKIIARYNIILDETKNAQGDFARTSDSLANSERRKNAILEDRKAMLGEKLIPLEKAWIDLQIEAADWFLGEEFQRKGLIALLVTETDTRESLNRTLDHAAVRAAAAAEKLRFMAGATKDDSLAQDDFGAALDRARPKIDLSRKAIGLATGAMQGFADRTITARDTTETMLQDMLDAVENKMSAAEEIARNTKLMRQIRDEMASEDPIIRAKAEALYGWLQTRNAQLAKDGAAWGKNFMTSYAVGIEAGLPRLQEAVRVGAGVISGTFKASSPPGPESPLHLIDVWGRRTTEAWVKGLVAGIDGRAVSGAVGGMASSFGMSLGGPGGGAAGGGGAAPMVAAGAGGAVQINLVVDGKVLASLVDEHLYYRRAAAPR